MNINQYAKKGQVSFKHLLSLDGISEEDIIEIILTAREFKNMRLVQEKSTALKGQYTLLVTKPDFQRESITYQIAIKELSGEPIITSLSGEKLESLIADSSYIKSLSACGLSSIVVCTSKCTDSDAFITNSQVPVVSSTAVRNPVEALSSLMTLLEHFPSLSGVKMTIVGDLSDGDYSFITGAVKLGADVTLLSTKDGALPKSVQTYLSQFASIKTTLNKDVAFKDAELIYFTNSDGDLYVSKKDLDINENKAKILSTIPVSTKLVDSKIFESENNLINKQTENLLHVSKAVLSLATSKKH